MTWQTIDTAPDDGTYVDLWVIGFDGSGSRFPDMKYSAGDTSQSNDWDDEHGLFSLIGDGIIERLEQVTHWMPRPAGPNGKIQKPA